MLTKLTSLSWSVYDIFRGGVIGEDDMMLDGFDQLSESMKTRSQNYMGFVHHFFDDPKCTL